MKMTKNKFFIILVFIVTLGWLLWGGNYGGKDNEKNSEQIETLIIESINDESNVDGTTDIVEAESETDKDKYLTDLVPEGKPKPIEWQDVEIDTTIVYHCQLSVDCATILDNLDSFDQDKLEILPKDGIIFPLQEVEFYQGESVFNLLQREMKKHKIHLEFVMTPMYNSVYIEGINNIYEFDAGELSGWMYKVNDWFPNYGLSRYQLQDGDVVNLIYTCNLGRDVGADLNK